VWVRGVIVQLAFATLLGLPAAAQSEHDAGKQHFRNGVKLYQDGNYSAALVEFEAAYRNKPSPAALQNVALAQKALFRYVAASDTLRRLLDTHAAEIGADDRRAVEEALAELAALLGSVVIRVVPPNAHVTLDDRTLGAAELGRSLRLEVGEHTLVAEAAGYARVAQTVRISGGQTGVPVLLTLKPTSGFISVEADDPTAAIAIDGKPVGYRQWQGPVPPGRHYVQAYKQDGTAFGRFVEVGLGKTAHVRATLGPEASQEPAARFVTTAAPAQVGWYGMLGLTALGMEAVPQGFDADQSKAAGGSLGLRGGYRLLPWFSAELMLEGARHTGGACPKQDFPGLTRVSCDGQATPADYELTSARVGPNARFMTTGKLVRFVSTLGFGLARHSFELPASQVVDGAASEWGGSGAYLLFELGGQLNLGHVLLELDLVATVDSIASLNSKAPQTAGSGFRYEQDSLSMVGLGLRGGYGQWSPK
jgi:hypothetical protein